MEAVQHEDEGHRTPAYFRRVTTEPLAIYV